MSAEFGGNRAEPGNVISQFGLLNAIQRPQTTVFGREAYPGFAEKAAAFVFALLQNCPFAESNRRLALAALVAFCEVNGRSMDTKQLDEKGWETLIKRAATVRQLGLAPESLFQDTRDAFIKAID